MRRRSALVVAVSLCSVLLIALAGHAGPAPSDRQTCPVPVLGFDPDSVSLFGPLTLWPPNHQLVPHAVTASETNEGSDHSNHVTLKLTPEVKDESPGTGDVVMDPPSGMASGTGDATVNIALRAERSGPGDGRTYVIHWMAVFDNGFHPCSSEDGQNGHHPFRVVVPHDQGM